MADHRTHDHLLIEQYLANLRASLAARRDRDEVVTELRDHLLATMQRYQEAGLTHLDAQRRAVDDAGEVSTVATAYVSNSRGRPAVPTDLTRLGGIAGYAGVLSVVITGIGWPIGDVVENRDGWGSGAQVWYSIGALGVLTGAVCLLILAIATVRRHGGLGPAGWLAIVASSLGALCSILAWAVAVWASLLAVAWLVLAAATRRAGLAPPWAMGVMALGFAALPILNIVSDEAAQAGWSGDAWAQLAGPAVALASVIAIGAGTVAMGRWLTSEEAVDVNSPSIASA